MKPISAQYFKSFGTLRSFKVVTPDSRKPPNLCRAYCCHKTRKKVVENGRVYYRALCARHSLKAEREKNPVGYFYNIWKARLRARLRNKNAGIKFEDFCKISKKEFARFWTIENAGKWAEKLRGVGDWSIDRIKNSKPYEVGNIQVITKTANVRKYWNEDRHESEFDYGDLYGDREPKPAPPF